MNKKRVMFSVIALWLAIVSCNLPGGNPQGTVGDIAATATSLALTVQAGQQGLVNFTETPSFTPSPQPAETQCLPTLTANSDVNVRTGPGTVYPSIGYLPQGGTAPVAGKSNDGTWWYVQFPAGPGGYGWMAGSVTTAVCIPASLAVIAAPPTPIPPSPTFTPSPTPTGLLLIPFVPIVPLFKFGDIKIQDVFLAATGEIVVRVAVDPVNSLSGDVTYKVRVDGALVATKTEALPAGSILYWSGQSISGSHTVKVTIDTANAFAETHEDNNTVEVVLSH